jgi:glucosamine-6-phosphate deaminase
MASPERIPVRIFDDHEEIALIIAERIAELIRARRTEDRPVVLGLATGSTPLGVYRELVRLHREEGLSLARVVTFNLDEYWPMRPDSLHSYHRYMRENFFHDVDIPEENIHLPRGDVPEEELEAACAAYEEAIRAAGGIDFQILGIGRTGHIGFNEPGSGAGSRTRPIYLDTATRRDAAADFFGEDNVPLQAVTMGVGTILEAREIVLVALGEHKAAIVKRAVEGPIDPQVAATFLQEHPHTSVFLDRPAAADLTREATPWLLDEVDWTPRRETEAVAWLSRTVNKSILRLETRDYRDHHLSALVARWGSAAPLNGEVFNRLIAKIRGRSKLPDGKRVLVFSPHPDDDVIAMGGILHKLHQNGNHITVAYQTSGNIAVFDHEVRRYLDFLRRSAGIPSLAIGIRPETLAEFESHLAAKQPGEVDPGDVLAIKRAIRESEAVSAVETLGLKREQTCFLNLPFYQTGKVRKDPVGEKDVAITLALLEAERPDLLFAAGDYTDPHGTHRMCRQVIDLALERYSGPAPEIWLYRGAWAEWTPAEASVLVPMSADELKLKILAIFKHQSQKDKAPFPGVDDREFWQRVQERNIETARLLERLGLPAYFALEAYVVEHRGERLQPEAFPTSALGR